jgi:osmoprotectant transport system permease protein
VEAAYGLAFKGSRSFQPTFMYRALGTGEADVISAFSSDGRIAADRLTVLTDPRSAIPPYDAVILVSPKRARDRRLLEALQPLVGSITVEAIRSANYTVDRDTDKLTPAQAAQALRRP